MPPPRPSDDPRATAGARWSVRLLGRVEAHGDDGERVDRFGGASVSGLLARLALEPARSHPREELIDRLWPDVTLEVGRNRLRQALFALRALLEPPGTASRPVLVADRHAVRVVDGALTCDVTAFERAVREGRHHDAQALYRGEFMPGRYEEWIDEERQRLAALAERSAGAVGPGPAAPRPPEVVAGGAPAAARRERSSLPVYLNRMLGREAERRQLLDALAANRLVTLVGPGGCGKTRLAVATVERLAVATPGSPARAVLFVPLVGCVDRDGLLDALAVALRLTAAAGAPLERLVDALDARPTCLVLDNFEQLVHVAADVVATLLASLPDLTVLVTSRRLLGVDGERPFPVPTLPLPDVRAPLATVADNPAVALFVDRARSVRADFHLSERNRVLLAELVRALDGLPLAIEIAASRVRSVSPAEMLAHLRPPADAPATPGAALALLERSAARGLTDPRHASMLRTIAWSWELLAPPAQRLLAELTVFDGGCTAAAAAAVATAGERPTLLELDELVAHSLVHAHGAAQDGASGDTAHEAAGHPELATRFDLDATIRDFAAARLAPDAQRAARERHRQWVVAAGDAQRVTPLPALVRTELRNVQQAVHAAGAAGDARGALAVMVAWRRGLQDVAVPPSLLSAADAALAGLEGAAGAPSAVAADSLDDAATAALASRAHTLLARLWLAAGAPEASQRHAARGLDLARALATRTTGHDGLLARALHTAASVQWRTVRDAPATRRLLDAAEPLAEAAGADDVLASVWALRGFVANVSDGEPERAAEWHGRALAVWERIGDRVAANSGRYNLAVCAMRAGRPDEVLARLREVRADAERQHDWRLLSQALNVEGEAHMLRHDLGAAVQAYRASLELAWTAFAHTSFAYALWNLPHPLSRRLDPELAATLAGAAERFWTTRIGHLSASDRRELDRVRRRCVAQVGVARTTACWRNGAALPLPELVDHALGGARVTNP